MTSSQHGPYAQGYTHATMVGTKAAKPRGGANLSKADRSSDSRLQLACLKLELLVTARQL